MNGPRIIIDCVLFLSIFFLPWWVTLSLALITLFFIPQFIEFVIVGFILDILYSAPLGRFFNFHFVLTLATLGMFLFAGWVKTRLRWSQ